ncbi:hypothetical protein BDV38DRAFT_244971 [Aspergillus pseudotamarii]|uniref:Secreted protein n=1 Tax=Aspergillus pseudotamarii TaxID=132259 RepID=A0A5N6SWV9_ASPPS|nr:uncharacterized protein BDV38DRAFT_244971 [Aspergillus pseudotamarii]KAE8138261.1 hypothetical protein BDV38DRAFT_244971 [Aspergillus pseudotamarii]
MYALLLSLSLLRECTCTYSRTILWLLISCRLHLPWSSDHPCSTQKERNAFSIKYSYFAQTRVDYRKDTFTRCKLAREQFVPYVLCEVPEAPQAPCLDII